MFHLQPLDGAKATDMNSPESRLGHYMWQYMVSVVSIKAAVTAL